MTLWKGRIAGSLDASTDKLNRSLPTDIRLLPYDVRVNRAWIAELAALSIITKTEAEDLNVELESILREYAQSHFDPAKLADEDVHSLVERLLTERVGAAGAKVHTGRSRNDQVATDLRLFLKHACDEIAGRIVLLARAVLDLAEEHAETLMPGYTHLQPAQPITLGFDLAAFAAELVRDIGRFKDARRRADECPLGSGALAGSGIPVSRTRLAEALGFVRPTTNAMDGVSARDAVLEFVNAAGICAINLSRRAEEWIIRSTREFSHHLLPDSTSTGSSMMPQKRNPDGLELVRAKAATILGRSVGLAALLKGLPHAYNKDLQEDKAAVFDVFDTLLLCLDVIRVHLDGVVFDKKRMVSSIPMESAATDFADALAMRGVPFREAHERVATVVREAEEDGAGLGSIGHIELAEKLDLPIEDVIWSPAQSVKRRSVFGGTAPDSVRRQIALLRKELV